MGSAKIQDLLDPTAIDSGERATNSKNSAKIALYSFLETWHYRDSRQSS
jgi:hypothetical protein